MIQSLKYIKNNFPDFSKKLSFVVFTIWVNPYHSTDTFGKNPKLLFPHLRMDFLLTFFFFLGKSCVSDSFFFFFLALYHDSYLHTSDALPLWLGLHSGRWTCFSGLGPPSLCCTFRTTLSTGAERRPLHLPALLQIGDTALHLQLNMCLSLGCIPSAYPAPPCSSLSLRVWAWPFFWKLSWYHCVYTSKQSM